MIRWSGYALIALGVIHILVLGVDIPGELPRWLSGGMWTLEHWQPVRSQSADMVAMNSVFWATLGSLAVPLALLGSLIVWMDRRRLPIPTYIGWVLVGWSLIMSLLMPPSGLPLVLLASLCLAIGLQRQARRT